MTLEQRMEKMKITWIVTVLLGMLAGLPSAVVAQGTTTGEQQTVITRDAGQDEQEEALLDREQEKSDLEQEKKDQEQERLDQMQELYDDGRGYLDEEDYGDAVQKFSELAAMNGPQTDAALYWKAYAQNRQGKKEAALATIADLKKRFPQSRWKKDAEALEIEVRSGTGVKPNPDVQSDESLKMLAIRGLMNSDPERAIPLLEKVLNGPGTPKEKSQALFVLAQSGSPQAAAVLGRIAQGQSNPDLQRKAIEYLGIFGGKRSGDILVQIYTSSNDPGVKRAVIRAYMGFGRPRAPVDPGKK